MQKLAEKFPDQVQIVFNKNPLGMVTEPEVIEERRRKWMEENPGADPNSMPGSIIWDTEFSFADMKACDVFLANNITNYGGNYLARSIGKAHELGKFVHFDTDDLLTNLYEEHRLFDVYKEKQLDKITAFVYNNVHLVTCTQQEFAKQIKPHCSAMLGVIRNAIDYELPAWNAPRIESDRVRIGWAGGIHHFPDVRVFQGVPHLVNQKVGVENVIWDLYGHPPPSDDPNYAWQKETWNDYVANMMRGMKGVKNYRIHNALPPHMYGRVYANMDISIAPLKSNLFNECKSDIKLAECGRYKVPLVASDVGCYRDTIINGQNGYLLPADAKQSDWVKVLVSLIRNKKKIKEMGESLHEITERFYDINKVVKDRLLMYSESFKTLNVNPIENRAFDEELRSYGN